MTDFVVDVGNSRMKWGRCSPQGIGAMATLPLDDTVAWSAQLSAWQPRPGSRWLLAGVNPEPLEKLVGFLKEANQSVQVLSDYRDVPIDVDVLEPSGVGIDRLLNALAVLSRRQAKTASVIVSVGSAVTVDVLDESGVFRGGAILPGLRLMAQALHDYTAKLPPVEVREPKTSLPGRSTTEAMVLGIHNAVVGGIALLVHRYRAGFGIGDLWLSGGDGPLIVESLRQQLRHSGLATSLWPEMTLEGIRLAGDRASLPVLK